jgi:hypothetical protein
MRLCFLRLYDELKGGGRGKEGEQMGFKRWPV